MFSKILCAVDGSDDGKKAMDCAIDLTKKYGSKLTVMYVVPKRLYVAAEEAGFTMTATLTDEKKRPPPSMIADRWPLHIQRLCVLIFVLSLNRLG